MRIAEWSAYLLLAACNQGIVVEVRTDPGMVSQQVELFFGLEHCRDCPPIRPERMAAPLSGDVYFRDNDERFLASVDADGSAWFYIESGPLGSRVERMLAVGLASDQAVAAIITGTVDVASGSHWILQLESSREQLPSDVNDVNREGAFAKIWKQQLDPSSSCIAFETWTNNQLDARTFIVPRLDPDCDDLTDDNGECNAYEHLGAVGPSFDALSCTTVDSEDACVLGGPTCVDGVGPANLEPCGPANYCVPGELCSLCANAASPGELRKCLEEALGRTFPPKPALTCRLSAMLSGGGGGGGRLIPCPGTDRFTVDLSTVFPGGCERPRLAATPSVAGWAPFEDSVKVASGQGEFELRIDPPSDPCTFPFEWSGSADYSAAVSSPTPLIKLTPTSSAPARSLLLPVEVRFMVDGCARPSRCELQGDPADPVFSCATPPPPVQPYVVTFGERPDADHRSVTTDTHVDSAAGANAPSGADPVMQVKGQPRSNGLIRFDLASGGLPPGTQIVAARLSLYTTDLNLNAPGFSVHAVNLTEAWNEQAIWTERLPGVSWAGGMGMSMQSYGPPLFTVPAIGPFAEYSIDLPTSMVEQWIAYPSSNQGLALVAGSTTSATFLTTSEALILDKRPQLELTIQP